MCKTRRDASVFLSRLRRAVRGLINAVKSSGRTGPVISNVSADQA